MSTKPIVAEFRDRMLITYGSVSVLGNETGDSVEAWEYPDKTIDVFGTGTVTVEGSPDGTNWLGLKDQTGTLISIVVAAASGRAFILENTKFIRAKNTSATGVLAVIACSK
jgi:hypothetical protein